jgi:chromosome segregation protein
MANKEQDPVLEPALRDVDSIQNLDTARLALRWALERMRALERRATELEGDARIAANARDKAASDLEGTRDLLTRRANEALERERYYAKIEEYLNLKLEGGLDAAALAAREVRIDAREAELQKREVETAHQVKAAKLLADGEIRRVQAEAAAAVELQTKAAREEFERRGAERDRDQAERLVALHEKEAQISALERSLEERRKRFEEHFAAQRAALQRESASITQSATDLTSFMESRIEKALAARTSALERAWESDKQILMEELATWRAKAREHLPGLLEAQRKAAALEGEATRLADENRLLNQTKALLSEELHRWRQEAQDDVPALLASTRRAADAEMRVVNLEGELAMAQRRAEEHLAELMSVEMSRELRMAEVAALEGALITKMRDAEQNMFRQYDAWLEREAALRRRDHDWRLTAEAREEFLNARRAEIVAQREELRRVIAEYREKSAALGPRGAAGPAPKAGDGGSI